MLGETLRNIYFIMFTNITDGGKTLGLHETSKSGLSPSSARFTKGVRVRHLEVREMDDLQAKL